MKRWAFTLAAGCVLLFAGILWWHCQEVQAGCRISARQAKQRYYQSQPHHWRSLVLKQ